MGPMATAQAPSKRPVWLIVLALAMALFGSLTLVEGLITIRDPKAMARMTLRDVAMTPSQAEVAHTIASNADARGVEMSGSMTGAMQIDRERGWMTDSFFTLLIRSVVTPPSGTGTQPMKFVTKITQRLQTMDKR